MIKETQIFTMTKESDQDYLSNGTKRQSHILLAEKILRTYSPSGGEKELAKLLHSELRHHGLSPRIDAAGNVICEIGSGSPSLLLCPHIDTVPGKLPFRREGNVLYARGASDAKGALLSMLFAFEDIADEVESDSERKGSHVILAAVVEEEKESKGLNQLIVDKVRAEGAIFGEPGGVNRITFGYRGHLPLSFEITTKQAHASAPWTTTNAAEVAFLLYKTLQETFASAKSQGVDSISVAITKIEAGTSHNVIPGNAKVSIDVRIPIGMSSKDVATKADDVVTEIEKLQNCKIHTILSEATEPYKAKLDSKLVRAMSRSMIKSELKPSFLTKSGTGDMNTYALTFGVDALTYGPGDPRLSHTDSESIDIEEVFSCAKVLVRTYREFFGLSI
jgi:[amino group carrier protein]-lysine/ornithine hydrolase